MATWQSIIDWLGGGSASQPALNQQPTTKQQPNGATGVVGGPQVGPVEHKYYYSDVGAAIRLGALVHGPGATELLGAATGHGQDANSAVFACLTVLCKAHIEAQPRVYQRHPEGGEDEVVANHPFELLMERPNPHMSGLDVQWWTQWARHVHGNAYWRKVRAGDKTSGNVIEYWPVSPVTIAPVTTKEDRRRGIFISYYKWEYETGKYEDVPIENIVHFKFGIDDSDHRLGVSPLRRLIRHAMGDDAATRFAASLLDNYAVPGMVVTTDADLDENDFDEIKRKLSMRFGSGQQGNVAVLTNGMKAEPFGFSPEQLDLKMLHRLPEERIAAVMGVPAVIAGLGAGIDKCLPAAARVWTPQGAVRIADLRPGAIVWSYVQGALEPRRVVHQWKTGFRRVYELKTKNRTLRATDNHPFLVRIPGNVSGANALRHPTLAWRRLDGIKPGDYVVQPKRLPDQGGRFLPNGEQATPDIMQFLGAILGDGTVSAGAGVRMAMPPQDRCVKDYRELATTLFTKYGGGGERPWKRAQDGLTDRMLSLHGEGQSYRAIGRALGMNNATVRSRIVQAKMVRPVKTVPITLQETKADFGFSSAHASRMLDDWGFGGRAKTKRIPPWVWGLAEDLRLALLAGLVDTDGTIDKRGALTFIFCNRDLTHDVRDLLVSVGIQACNVRHGRVSASVLPQPGLHDFYEHWAFTASSAAQVARIPFVDPLYRERVNENMHREKRDGFDAQKAGLSDALGFYQVTEIREVESEDVYDIEVEGGHSFVADGIVVSNSIYNNYRESREAMTEQTILPMYQLDAATLTLQALPDFTTDRTLHVKFDISNMRGLQEDEDKKYARLSLGVREKWITRNEARAEVGLPPIEGGDELTPPALPGEGSTGTPGGAAPGSMNPSVMPAPSTTRGALFGTEKKARIRPEEFPELLEAIRELATPAMTETMDRYFQSQKDRIVERLLADIDDPGTANPDSARGALPRLR